MSSTSGTFASSSAESPLPSGASEGNGEGRHRLLGFIPRGSVLEPERESEDTAFTWPHLLVRHSAIAAGTVIALFALSMFVDAPLKAMANPDLTPPVAKAPWYFAGLQELLSHLSPLLAGVLIPAAAIAGLLLLPFIDRGPSLRLGDRKVVVVGFSVAVAAAVVLTVIGAFFRGPGWSWVWPWQKLFLEL